MEKKKVIKNRNGRLKLENRITKLKNKAEETKPKLNINNMHLIDINRFFF